MTPERTRSDSGTSRRIEKERADRAAARQKLKEAQRALEKAAAESARIGETLAKSQRVRKRAIPVLKRAGYLK